jgi:hypothetical protein
VTRPIIHEPVPITPLKSIVQNLDQSPEIKSTTNVTSPFSAPSKTAALIEMYRERERGGTTKPPSISPVGPLAASRLPVRTSSLNKDVSVPAPVIPAVTIPPPPKVAPPSPKPSSPEPEHLDIDVPHIPFDDPDRSSPLRYVHGAPLHNVLEEEEEED